MNVKSGYGKSPAVGINNVQLTNPSNVDIDSPDGGEPKKAYALRLGKISRNIQCPSAPVPITPTNFK